MEVKQMKFSTNNLKVMIIASFTVFMFLAFIFSDFGGIKTEASEGGAPTGRTGAPGESNCTDCHAANSGSGQISIIAPSNYTPGQTYQIQVQHATADTTRKKWGFELISLAGTAMAGSYTNTTTNTRIRAAAPRSYVTHTTAGTYPNQLSGAVWTFSWTAPATNVGNVTFYAAGLQGDNDGTEDGDQTYTANVVVQPQAAVVIHHGFADFDADGKADASVYRSSNGIWYVNRSTAGFMAIQWGLPTDKLTPADFDGDDKADIAVWREGAATVAGFYIFQSTTSTVRIDRFGQTGDDATIVGDWDGDGKADPAVYRNGAVGSQSYFYYRGSLNNLGGAVTYVQWGTTGDRAMRGDFDGDGKFDVAVFRPTNEVWYISQSSNGTIRYENWGLATDKFVPADYDGDAKTDLAVFRSGVWYIKQSSNAQAAYINWGLSTDILVPADYDGDGKTDAAVYRAGIWYLRLSSSGSMSAQSFGLGTDAPVANAFVK
jgi:hypothetical protein